MLHLFLYEKASFPFRKEINLNTKVKDNNTKQISLLIADFLLVAFVKSDLEGRFLSENKQNFLF